MRIVIEGALSKQEVGDLVCLLKAQDLAHPERVVSIVFEEHDWEFQEYLDFCDNMGLHHKAVLPSDQQGEIHFEKGGGVRLIPFNTGGPNDSQ